MLMSIYLNIGYWFKIQSTINPDGSVILGSAMPMHQLERRRIDDRYPHMKNRLFDPQLYLAGLDANESKNHCVKLASYPWFNAVELQEYDSKLQSQALWKQNAMKKIASIWPRKPPEDPVVIRNSVRDCIDFQVRLGSWGIILPSPLTANPGTSYDYELFWLDSGLEYIRSRADYQQPVFATVALTDVCVRYLDPPQNQLLSLILDAVSAREVDGVYIVIEQGSELSETRYFQNTRSLESALHLVQIFKHDSGLNVGVNFFGPFGLALEAAGADFWATGWYKSLIRLRLADKLGGGRAYPSYWSYPAAVDIHLESDFDRLNNKGILGQIADNTEASKGLLSAASRGVSVRDVPAWQYAQSNVSSAMEHYLLSTISAENSHSKYKGKDKLDQVEDWLSEAVKYTTNIGISLGTSSKTRLDHVQSWLDAFRGFRRDHNV
jgi:hypothetical protein